MGNTGAHLCPTGDEQGDASFDSEFEVDEDNYLGTGKFSVVHLCWRKSKPEQRFALKVIRTYAGDQANLMRIYEEINILKVLGSHPSIIQLVDMDESQSSTIRLVLELCEGGELYDRVQQKRFYPEGEAKLLAKNLLEAVAYIHSKGIMHRDLKPENILLASKVNNTEIKISDFGLARLSPDYPRKLPRSHSICGSDFYLAPEIIKQEEYGRETDIWSAGVVTYVVLSGTLPFFNNVLHKLYRQIVERDISFPDPAWRNISKGAQDFILRLLQVRPGDRLTAEQALNHPWLRSAGSPGTSFAISGSFRDQQIFNPNYYSSHAPQPLEHAHKVNPGPLIAAGPGAQMPVAGHAPAVLPVGGYAQPQQRPLPVGYAAHVDAAGGASRGLPVGYLAQ